MKQIFIGLGSNIDPERNLRKTATLLRKEWPLVRFSSVYQSAARDYEQQEDFLNAVATLETALSPESVLSVLQGIEKELGKATPFRYGPRVIDLDLLLYNELVIPGLKEWQDSYQLSTTNYTLLVPHQRLHERRFVLEPLCELLSPDDRHPVLQKTWGEFLATTQDQQCKLLRKPEEFVESLQDASSEPVEESA